MTDRLVKKTSLRGLGATASPELVALGGSVRALTDVMLRIEGQPEDLAWAREQLDAVVARLQGAAKWGEAVRLGRADEPDDARPYYIDGVMLPAYHPLASDFEIATEDGVTTGSVAFDVVFEGPPGCVHGGHVACFFDQLLGYHNLELGLPAMTASLTVQYRRPTPLFQRLDFDARIRSVDGRKIIVEGALRAGAETVAQAEGLFVLPSAGISEQLARLVRPRNSGPPAGAGSKLS